MKSELKNIFFKCLNTVNPAHLIRSSVSVKSNELKVLNEHFPLENPCYLVGFGKAVYEMAIEMETILGDRLLEGVISVPIGIKNTANGNFKPHSVINVFEGAKDNLPDERSYKAAVNIENLASKLQKTDTLIVLISGGGSALLSYPVPPITVHEKLETVRLIASAGADIVELNCVRKALSRLKGGKLARLAYPARIITLILSDVIGDPVESIASGPTVLHYEHSTRKAVDVLVKYELLDLVPSSVQKVLRDSEQEDAVLCPGDAKSRVHNLIIGNNSVALTAAKQQAELYHYGCVVCSNRIRGLVPDISCFYSLIVQYICSFILSRNRNEFAENLQNSLSKYADECFSDVVNAIAKNIDLIEQTNEPLCFICGGEPTVEVTGTGTGGRNQELALHMSLKLHELKSSCSFVEGFEILFLSAGTDGIDGPTDAAGALSYLDLVKDAQAEDLNPLKYLRNNDSYNFFSRFRNQEYIIKTGNTGTNVMDVHIIFIKKKKKKKKK